MKGKNQDETKSSKVVELDFKSDKPKKTKKKLDSFDVASAVVIGLLIWAGISLSFTFIEQQMEISVLKERKLALETQIKQEEKELKKIEFPLNNIEMILEDAIYIPTMNLSKSLIIKLKSRKISFS